MIAVVVKSCGGCKPIKAENETLRAENEALKREQDDFVAQLAELARMSQEGRSALRARVKALEAGMFSASGVCRVCGISEYHGPYCWVGTLAEKPDV